MLFLKQGKFNSGIGCKGDGRVQEADQVSIKEQGDQKHLQGILFPKLEPQKEKAFSKGNQTQAGIKIARRNINNLRYADATTLMAESEKELKSLLRKVKVESEKVGLKLNIQKTKIMASGPITSWEIDGETVSDFIFGAPKSLQMVTAAMKLKDTYSLGEKL